MEVIIIRGLPSSGKTTIAHKLEIKLNNSEVIHLDDFIPKSIEKSSYKNILLQLNKLHKERKNIIIEGPIYGEELLDLLTKFIKGTNSKFYWFKLERPFEVLLKLESNRRKRTDLTNKRRIENPKENLIKTKKNFDSSKIIGEHIIKNDSHDLTVKKILDIIE